eukprot:4674751-Lingulodinium_polyedra.AAC.1
MACGAMGALAAGEKREPWAQLARDLAREAHSMYEGKAVQQPPSQLHQGGAVQYVAAGLLWTA